MGADAAASEQFGPYLVYERLGVGGMATVHRALEHGIEGFERIVALKRLLPHLAADATFIKSFVREAKLASLLNHVNIVQIFELGRVATNYFISMEYIDGRDVRRILRQARKVSGPPPINVTVGLLLQLCEALDYAHHKVDDDGHPLGLVHRDVSPSNVLVTHAGQVKVIDFGIAKAQSSQLRTQTGKVKGKLAYMAPEALTAKDLDARSDLYAAGIIAHELITALPLFASKNEYQTLMKVQRGEVKPPSTFNPSCPPELDAIVLRALARDREDRFAHAGELRDELNAMRKQYGLQTADRDIASWLEAAFRVTGPGAGNAADPAPGKRDGRAPSGQRTSRNRGQEADEVVDLAWGGNDDHGDGEPIVLDDVLDVSHKHLEHASALGADARVDLDDLADDIPTPLPSHGRPTVDLSARTVTTPLLPRDIARNKASARGSQAVPVQSDDSRPDRVVPAAPARPAGTLGDDSVDEGISENADNPGLPVPPRARTITIPPRQVPSSSAPPRNIAAAMLPPRTADQSRGIPIPVAPSRSGAVAAEPSRGVHTPGVPSRGGAAPGGAGAIESSRGVPVATATSRSAAVAAGSSRGVAAGVEPSHGVPLEPSYTGSAPADPPRSVPAAIGTSRPGPLPILPPRSAPVAMQPRSGSAAVRPPRAAPSASSSPRRRRPTSPGAGTPPADSVTALVVAAAAAPASRDSSRDTVPIDRSTFTAEDLGLAADTMPSFPAMQTSESVVRFREPAVLPPVTAASPAFAPPAAPTEPELPAGPDALVPPDTTTTGRARRITPATALFAEPEPETEPQSEPQTETHHEPTPAGPPAAAARGMPRPWQTVDPDGVPIAMRRITLGRVALAVVGLVLLSAATTGIALYLTQDGDLATDHPPVPRPASSQATGKIHLEIAPADSAITIDGRPVRPGPMGVVELEPGPHQIEIDHAGYRGWLTSIEVVAGQIQPLRVSLEGLGTAIAAEATLSLPSAPAGFDIVVDGAVLATTSDRPPGTIKLSITAGHHIVALRASGADVWTKELDARASAIYELHPRIGPLPGPGSDARATQTPPAPAMAGSVEPATDAATPPPGQVIPDRAAAVSPGSGSPPAAPTPATVPSTAVTRIAGPAPRVTALPNTELPSPITAKLCIDETGHVTGAEMITALDPGTAKEIIDTLRTWQYAPYLADGAARAACFPVTFRVK